MDTHVPITIDRKSSETERQIALNWTLDKIEAKKERD
jgi:hypothetical protein